MKAIQLISASAALALTLSAAPLSAFAAETTLYGTMNIPYTEFYAAELGSSAGTVDAVTSATKTKALKNGEGELFEGTYNNGEDTILGVTYPVAITQADLDALGSDNYGFTALDAAPEAYKTVTVSDGKATFSAVQDASPETAALGVKLSTETPWGDYLIDLTNQPEGFDIHYRGAILKTADGKAYAMRHEQNIWRGEIAWSSGIKTSEPHGNQLDYAAYVDLMGSTVTEITLITTKGYVTVSTNTYIPVKFQNTLTVENGDAGTGSTTFTAEGIPSDYQKQYAVGDGFTATDGSISYTDALPGSYTLTVSDGAGKYANLVANFVLETDALPVKYADGKLVAADGFTEADAANFIKNIASVTVGETAYSATGKGSTKIVGDDGTIDFAVESRSGAVFADGADGSYTLTFTATGYRNALTASTDEVPAETTTTTTAGSGTTTSTSATTTTQTPPATGDAGAGVMAALAGAAAAALILARKKKD